MKQLPDGSKIKNYTRNRVRFMEISTGTVIDIEPEDDGPAEVWIEQNHIVGHKYITRSAFSPKYLPEPEDDTFFIVPLVVKAAYRDRSDLVTPNRVIRTGERDDRLVVCQGFAI